MADPKDIEKTLEASDEDVLSLRRQGVDAAGGNMKMKSPIAETPAGLNEELLNMLKLGKKSYSFQGIDRCIRILESGTPNQRHCMSMMVNNLSTNQRICSSCDRIKDPNANPKVINSSMIRLSQKELEECGLQIDPLLNAKATEVSKVIPKIYKAKAQKDVEPLRRIKVAKPSSITIEVSMKDLEENPNIVSVLLKKTLEAVYELPITKFSEAEAIRGTSEKIKALLSYQAEPGKGE